MASVKVINQRLIEAERITEGTLDLIGRAITEHNPDKKEELLKEIQERLLKAARILPLELALH
jgi:hypothetical protein